MLKIHQKKIHHQLQMNERGFTLIEMLVVLAIFGLLTTFTFSMFFRFYNQDVYEQATERFRMTLQYAQQVAIQDQVDVRIYVEDGKHVIAKLEYQVNLMEWTLPDGMTIDLGSTLRGQIIFKMSGNVSQIGSLLISTPHGRQKYSVNLSKGRLRPSE